MITIKEIAKECNVSATTVSNILNGKQKTSEETKNRVLRMIEETGYHPNYIAQGLRLKKTMTIGIIAEDIAQFTTPAMVEGIMAYCEKCGYRTIVQNLRLYGRWSDSWFDQEDEYRSVLEPVLQEMISLKVDGVIYIAGHARIIQSIPDSFPVPVVMTYAYSRSTCIPSVVIDDIESSYEITKHLLSKGHQRIGVIGGRKDNIHTQKRLLGYLRALEEAGIPSDTEVIRYGNWERDSGYVETPFLLEQKVSAILCMADRMAGGVYDYLEEKGLVVGKDISVVGFDNQDIAEYFRPSLTTMALPLAEIGRQSARLLLEKLMSESDSKETGEQNEKLIEISVPCHLEERHSVTDFCG